ncbi:Multimodular transpeptidase-transglycosylase [Rubellimicrobium mesophilum DSM 19309]|uniref:peptidoglycan glycosyltransferase n=1 Tax=Rubellimicrobium mesophilum DSM 19309 TaxID=442562 RepID=A0A017HLS6_9RHOB|nr:penicillin-binding protein 1C [Rubellimicrobium mesophilum]EYD75280.1 Multimodular transpeptidase-transglycosylase [Rubellimicrobium mesophilum DSM 19309]
MRRGALALFALALALFGLAAGRDAFDAWVDATVLPPLVAAQSPEVLDRDGRLLRAYTVADGRWRMGVSLDAIDPGYVDMLVRYEDKRFWQHDGVDWRAMGRAAVQAVRSGGVVSGGSTLTMQVARVLEDSGTGRWAGKLRQIRVALALERRLSKERILELYLERAPFGGNLEGVRAASLAWFGKPPSRLTPAEAALLVAIPQAPEARRPDRHPDAAHAARDRVLARMARDGVLDAEEAQAALTEPVPAARLPFPMLAAHLADRARAETPLAPVISLTLDAVLQARLERLAAGAVRDGSERLQVAILVADHQTGEILASVGSSRFTDDARRGFLDMTEARRSPGSTLKPLIYGLGFDRGLLHPETLIADRPTDFGGWRPRNFDGMFRGEVRVRQALQMSLNIPAVKVLDALGPAHLMAGLRTAGASPELPQGSAGTPGLAIALGGVGLSLRDVTAVYAAIANGGESVDLRALPEPTPDFAPRRVLGEVAAWEVADILRDTPRPWGVRGEGIAFKTGTSYGHRDAWAMGFDGRHVVGVWMGRADGTPVPGAFGADLAAPILFAAFERLGPVTPLPPPPPATLIVGNEALPAPLRRFRGDEVPDAGGPALAFPPDGATVEGEALTARVTDGTPPFTWLANGRPVATSRQRELPFEELGPGFSRITVIDAEGRSASAGFELRAPG